MIRNSSFIILNSSFYLVTLLFIILQTNFAFSQTKVLLYYSANKSNEARLFMQQAPSYKIRLDTTSNAEKFEENTLKNYQTIIFLATSINNLSFRQSAELQRFMRAGGGFVGINTTLEKTYKWLWFEKMLGGSLAENQLTDKVQLSLITNANLGNVDLMPLWKIDDKPLILNALPVKCKPVLLDVMGKTWAWYYTTEEGGKMFYSALGGSVEAYQNAHFWQHIFAGIIEVSPKTLLDYSKIMATAVPSDKFFLKQNLTENLINPVSLVILPDNRVLIVEQSGNVKLYDRNNIKNIGQINANNIKGIRLDPEFSQNAYLYYFEEKQANDYEIKQLKLQNDSLSLMSNFKSQQSSELNKSVLYTYSKYENRPYRLPKYYDAKTFRFDVAQGFILETIAEDGTLKNVEPFLPSNKFGAIADFSFSNEGALYYLEGNRLMKVDYSETNRKPIAKASADIFEGNAPLKVNFSSAGSIDFDADALNYEWNFGDLTISHEQSIEYTYQKAGIYDVKLQVFDAKGGISEAFLQIKVNKPAIKKR